MATIPITKRGAEKLKEELHRLKTVDRPAVINAIAEARAQGDLSENAEYDAAKDRQGFIEGRIAEVEGKLSAAQIIDPSTVDAGGRVVFGATVDLEDEDSGAKVTYQIVGEDEADPAVAEVRQLVVGEAGHREQLGETAQRVTTGSERTERPHQVLTLGLGRTPTEILTTEPGVQFYAGHFPGDYLLVHLNSFYSH